MKPTVYKASHSDAVNLASQLRLEDVAEIRAATGQTPLAALWQGVTDSTACYAVSDEDGIFAMFGCGPTPTANVGTLWLLAADRLFTHRKELLRQARTWLDRLHLHYPILYNAVDARNESHIRWIKWLGCEFIDTRIAGVEQRPFLTFVHYVYSSTRHARHRSRPLSGLVNRRCIRSAVRSQCGCELPEQTLRSDSPTGDRELPPADQRSANPIQPAD